MPEAIVPLVDSPTYQRPGGNEVRKEHAHTDPRWHLKDVEENTGEVLEMGLITLATD